MSAILGALMKVDLSQVSAKVMEGLQTGKMILSSSNGIVYWATGSGNTGIVAHLTFMPVSPHELASVEQLLQVGQAVNGAKVAALTATAISTAVVVAAVVVATAYLAGKIDKVERSVKSVALTVGQQDQREYLRVMTDYTGAIMAAHELLNSQALNGEIASQAEFRIDKLAESRHQLLLYIRGLPPLVSSTEKTTEAQYDQAVRFMVEMLDLIPSALFLERELCLAAGKIGLAQSRIDHAAPNFREALIEFQKWCEEQYHQLALGSGRFVDVLTKHRESLNSLFNSSMHELLLGAPAAAFACRLESAGTEPQMTPSGAIGSNGETQGR